jgi:hypothetical protein
MKDDLKIFIVEYLSNHSLDLPPIRNLSLGDGTKKGKLLLIKTALMADDLKILKVQYLNNH